MSILFVCNLLKFFVFCALICCSCVYAALLAWSALWVLIRLISNMFRFVCSGWDGLRSPKLTTASTGTWPHGLPNNSRLNMHIAPQKQKHFSTTGRSSTQTGADHLSQLNNATCFSSLPLLSHLLLLFFSVLWVPIVHPLSHTQPLPWTPAGLSAIHPEAFGNRCWVHEWACFGLNTPGRMGLFPVLGPKPGETSKPQMVTH